MNRLKLIVNVPLTHADVLRNALANAGAGKYGNYSHCSFSIRGTGRFMPNAESHPFIGKANQLESVEEEQIQVDVLQADIRSVLLALKEAHPYEEPGYEIYQIVDEEIF